jgi:hypothetical protein
MLEHIVAFLKTFLLTVFVILTPIQPLILIIFGIVLLDTFFGIKRSWSLNILFTSRRFFSFFKKLLVYELVLITTFLVDFYLVNELVNIIFQFDLLVTKLIGFVITINELKSIEENIRVIYGINFIEIIKKSFNTVKDVKDGLDEIKKN